MRQFPDSSALLVAQMFNTMGSILKYFHITVRINEQQSPKEYSEGCLYKFSRKFTTNEANVRRYWNVYSYRYCAVDINATSKMFGKLRKSLRPYILFDNSGNFYYFYSFLEQREREREKKKESTRNYTRYFEI